MVGQVVLLARDLDLGRNILDERHDRCDLPLRIGQRRVEPLAMHLAAIVAHKARFGAVLRFLPGLQALQRVVKALIPGGAGHQLGQQAPLQARDVQPAHELNSALRTVQQPQVLVHLQHREGAVFHVRGQALVGGTQRVHGDLQFMHVERRGDEALHRALRVLPRCQADGAPFIHAVGCVQKALVLHTFTLQHALDKGHEACAVGLAIHLDQRLAHQLPGDRAKPPGVFVVDVNHDQVAVNDGHGGACAACDHIQQLGLGPGTLVRGRRGLGQLGLVLHHAAKAPAGE